MKIILLANKEQKEELLGNDIPAGITWSPEFVSPEIATGADACIDLLFDDTTDRLKKLQQLQILIIINSVVNPLHELNADCIRINGWNTFLKRPVIEATGHNDLREKAEDVFFFLNKKIEWVTDISGFISSRVVASIINEAYFALGESVSTKEEIDTAMKLGTNYPYGPFEWSKKIGLKNIYALLKRLSENQKRYTPATLLTKEAIA